jgi:hypothetical protein
VELLAEEVEAPLVPAGAGAGAEGGDAWSMMLNGLGVPAGTDESAVIPAFDPFRLAVVLLLGVGTPTPAEYEYLMLLRTDSESSFFFKTKL